MGNDGTGAAELIYAISRVGRFWVALPAARVVQIYDTSEDRDLAGAPVLDIAGLFGEGVDGAARRALRLAGVARDLVLLVGAKVEIADVGAAAAVPLPDLVDDHYRAVGVTGLLARPQGLVCVLDADRLAARASGLAEGGPA